MRPTGMPVQSATTLATACASTDGMISGASPCSVGSACACSACSSAEQPRRGSGACGCVGSAHRPAWSVAAQLARAAPSILSTIAFSSCQRASSPTRRSRSTASFSATSIAALADRHADRCLAVDDALLDLQRLDAALAVLDLGRGRVLADRDAGAGGVEQADRLVGQLARRNVAVRQPAPPPRSPRRATARGGASPAPWPRRAASGSALASSGSGTCTTWKRRVSAGSFSMYFLYSAQVVAPMVRRLPRASAGLSRLAASPVPAAPPAPTSVWTSSMNRMIGFGRGLHLVDDLAQALLELALHRWRRPAAGRGRASAATRPSTAAARRRAPGAARSLRPPPSCRRRPRRSGSGCSGAGASGCRRSGGFPRRGR